MSQLFGGYGNRTSRRARNCRELRLGCTIAIGHQRLRHGALAGFLKKEGADVLICGGIGAGARQALEDAGIRFYPGVTGEADEAVKALLEGRLSYQPDVVCSHHHEGGHQCGSHACGEDKHGCAGNE